MVRQAIVNDLPQLSILFNEYRVFYRKPPDKEGAYEFLRDRIEKKESILFVEDNAGTLTGFVQMYPLFSSTRMRRTWLLNDLYVLPAYRGTGISKKLIEAAKQLARETGAAGILLETEKANTIGNRLYPSAGFVLYDETNFYWWEEEY